MLIPLPIQFSQSWLIAFSPNMTTEEGAANISLIMAALVLAMLGPSDADFRTRLDSERNNDNTH
eukprot:scaffold2927_cov268-Chaetoceros_neogracile.AAC.46